VVFIASKCEIQKFSAICYAYLRRTRIIGDLLYKKTPRVVSVFFSFLVSLCPRYTYDLCYLFPVTSTAVRNIAQFVDKILFKHFVLLKHKYFSKTFKTFVFYIQKNKIIYLVVTITLISNKFDSSLLQSCLCFTCIYVCVCV
jgi:hypothetical protein